MLKLLALFPKILCLVWGIKLGPLEIEEKMAFLVVKEQFNHFKIKKMIKKMERFINMVKIACLILKVGNLTNSRDCGLLH